jgi:hypothetical protein
MRGLKQDRSARVVIAGHAFMQNIRRANYEPAIEETATLRLAVAFEVGQAVTAGLRFWRGRRLRGVLSAARVARGLRPRFFSVLPAPANFRSR